MAIHSINHVQLPFPAGEEGAMRAFYAGLLGLPEVRYPAEDALHVAAGHPLEFLGPDTEAGARA